MSLSTESDHPVHLCCPIRIFAIWWYLLQYPLFSKTVTALNYTAQMHRLSRAFSVWTCPEDTFLIGKAHINCKDFLKDSSLLIWERYPLIYFSYFSTKHVGSLFFFFFPSPMPPACGLRSSWINKVLFCSVLVIATNRLLHSFNFLT